MKNKNKIYRLYGDLQGSIVSFICRRKNVLSLLCSDANTISPNNFYSIINDFYNVDHFILIPEKHKQTSLNCASDLRPEIS